MAIENFNEVKTYFETNKDNDEVKTFVNGLNPITTDRVKSLVDTDKDLKSWLDSVKDIHASKSLETWKTNNLDKLIDDKVKELYPQADPKDTELAKLKAQLDQMQKDTVKKDLTNKALKIAQEKKLPIELVDFFVSNDEETTTNNLNALEKVFSNKVEALVAERLKGGYVPPKDDKGATTFTREQISKMSPEEINKNWEAISKIKTL